MLLSMRCRRESCKHLGLFCKVDERPTDRTFNVNLRAAVLTYLRCVLTSDVERFYRNGFTGQIYYCGRSFFHIGIWEIKILELELTSLVIVQACWKLLVVKNVDLKLEMLVNPSARQLEVLLRNVSMIFS